MTDNNQTPMFEENWKGILAGLGIGAASLLHPHDAEAASTPKSTARVVQTNLPAATNSVTPANIIV